MKIAVAGGTGFVGQPLVVELLKSAEVIVLSRDPSRVRAGRGVAWDPSKPSGDWKNEVADAQVIVNLAGDNIGSGRWTAEKKRRMVSSRLDATHALTEVIRSRRLPGRVLINASAVGYYGSRGDQILTEDSSPGSDFLADLCRQWEAAAREAEDSARVVILRFGVVLGPGGALEKMALPFRLFAGGPIGNGRQWLSWVDRFDLIRAVVFVIERDDARGAFNVTAPNPVTNREFAKTLGAVLRRPSFFPTPAPVLRVALGEMADGMLLASQRAIPERLGSARFSFEVPEVRGAVEKALRR